MENVKINNIIGIKNVWSHHNETVPIYFNI